MNEVDAVIRRIAKPLLMASDFLEIGPAIASLFSKREGIRRFSTKAYRVVRWSVGGVLRARANVRNGSLAAVPASSPEGRFRRGRTLRPVKSGGMAARYHSGYPVSGGVECSLTQKPWRPETGFTWISIHIPVGNKSRIFPRREKERQITAP